MPLDGRSFSVACPFLFSSQYLSFVSSLVCTLIVYFHLVSASLKLNGLESIIAVVTKAATHTCPSSGCQGSPIIKTLRNYCRHLHIWPSFINNNWRCIHGQSGVYLCMAMCSPCIRVCAYVIIMFRLLWCNCPSVNDMQVNDVQLCKIFWSDNNYDSASVQLCV